jgi:hypothetical protein
MSRARHSTQVWAVADDLPQAAEDLRRDWSTRRTATWAIDSALPEVASLNRDRFQALPQDQQTRLAALFHAQEAIGSAAITGIRLPDRAATLGQAQQALDAARQARADLDTGRGVWADTEAGQAVRDLAEAGAARERAEQTAEHGDRWRDRRAARKEALEWAGREADAQQRWTIHVAPQIASLDHEIFHRQTTLERTAARVDRRAATTKTVIDYGLQQQRYARRLGDQVSDYRDNLDGVPTATDIRRAAILAARRPGIARVPHPEPPPERHTAPDL